MGCNNTPSFFILVYVYVVVVVYVACVLKSVTCGDVMQTRVARVQSILRRVAAFLALFCACDVVRVIFFAEQKERIF